MTAIHRLGETDLQYSRSRKNKPQLDASRLIAAVEAVLQISADEFCSKRKNPRAVMAKGIFILIARDLGAHLNELAEITGLDISGVSRRYESARSGRHKRRQIQFRETTDRQNRREFRRNSSLTPFSTPA